MFLLPLRCRPSVRIKNRVSSIRPTDCDPPQELSGIGRVDSCVNLSSVVFPIPTLYRHMTDANLQTLIILPSEVTAFLIRQLDVRCHEPVLPASIFDLIGLKVFRVYLSTSRTYFECHRLSVCAISVTLVLRIGLHKSQ